MARGLTDFDPRALQHLRWSFPPCASSGKPGLTAAELARRVGATKAQIVAYENGRTVPDPKRVAELARALDVPPQRLMCTWNKDTWAIADLRRAAALTAAEVTTKLRISAKVYRRFEQQGIVPPERGIFLDELAALFGVSYGAVNRAMDNTPPVADRRLRADQLARELVRRYVDSDGPWREPRAKDELLEELAALYGRSMARLRPVLANMLRQLRQRSVLIQREKVVVKYDTDASRRNRAYGTLSQLSRNFTRELDMFGPRLESFHRTRQPSDVWQVFVDLHDLGARPGGVWAPVYLLAGQDTTRNLPSSFARVAHFGDLPAVQLTQLGLGHLRAFRHLYAALHPAVRQPASPAPASPAARARGQLADNQFTLPGHQERFAVPAHVMLRLQEENDLRGFAELPLSPAMVLVLGPAVSGSLPRPRPRPAETAPPEVVSPCLPAAPEAPGAPALSERAGTVGAENDALRRARLAHRVIDALAQHPLGVESGRVARALGLTADQLGPILAMLCEEEFAVMVAGDVYATGPALDRLSAPGGVSLQIQHTLDLARDTIGAAVYYSRYVDGEVQITHMAAGPITPPVNEWVDFKAAAHASAVGKSLLTQLPAGMRADHLARHRTARLTRRTITDPRHLISTLGRIAPNQPVYDLREYANRVVCGAVAASTQTDIGTLALSLPLASAHRLKAATQQLAHKAVPILLALLISKTVPTGPDDTHPTPEPTTSTITPAGLQRLRAVFRTPLTTPQDIRDVAQSPAPGPHLATDSTSTSLYLFEAPTEPTITTGEPHLVLPHTYTTTLTTPATDFTTAPHTTWRGHNRPDRLLVFRTQTTSRQPS
ncbi:helix-turn-helix domain-containing protein [Streptomyces sp. NBC_01367]|uniref:helix-turn-helix domain-containing protein n=1 Tax=Streptomyces sp. NBC_01367 TaxID=2903841 RepID=UPI00386BFE81